LKLEDTQMISNRFIHTAVAFFVVGVGLGMYMGITHDFRFTHVHVHINLLGWMSLALGGIIYAMYPKLQAGWLAPAHYWLQTLGLVIFMGGFTWGIISGTLPLAPVSTGASMVALGVLCFAINVFTRLSQESPAGQATSRASSNPRAAEWPATLDANTRS
jgi:hypothetical protein